MPRLSATIQLHHHKLKTAIGECLPCSIFFNSSRNSTKAAVSLEESGMAYKVVAIETRKRDQFKPECLQIKPERKGPRAQPREPL
jgi:hypothetical protein